MNLPKFRAWHIERKTMHEVSALNFSTYELELVVGFYFSQKWHGKSSINDVILMQSTGLKDKNGVEIFEGDVVSVKREDSYSSYNTGVVGYCMGVWGFNTIKKLRDGSFMWINLFDWEIENNFGSYLINPELLKGEVSVTE